MSMEMMSGSAILKMSFLTGIVPILFSCGMDWAGIGTSDKVFLHKKDN